MLIKEKIILEILDSLNKNILNLKKQWDSDLGYAKHFFVDNLLNEEVAKFAYQNFPMNKGFQLNQFSSFRERKKTFTRIDLLDKIIPNITDAFHDDRIIKKISEITSINALECDASLYAGGLSIMSNGDFLNPHIDNSHDSKRKRYRRLNLLYYLTPGWELKYGGNLELWNKNVTKKITILSKFNRLVIMNTNNLSWHSVNRVNVDKSRSCLSNYYFSKNSPNNKDYYNVTSFTGRPEETLKRSFGIMDNYLRQKFSTIFNVSRGKKYKRVN